MLLISIQPFALKKIVALFAALVCLSTASCFASTAMFLSVGSTPYDRQMRRILPVLVSGKGNAGSPVSLSRVNQWMGDLRGIPYEYHMEWKTPSEVLSREPADCKGKAVALYQLMQNSGAKNMRLVIGRRSPASRTTHTWLVWETSEGAYLLDPTFNWMACRAEQTGQRSYVPLYAFAGDRKFRAVSDARLVASN